MIINGIYIECTESCGKKVRLTISPKTGVPKLHIPKGFSEIKAAQFAADNSEWIRKHQEKIKQRINAEKEKYSIKDGGAIKLWGSEYKTKIIRTGKVLKFSIDEDFFYIKEPKTVSSQEKYAKRRQLLSRLYKKELQLYISEILPYWEKTINEKPCAIKFRDMKSKWGVCNITNRIITMNTNLAALPEECAETVLVHELIHFKERLHNERFKRYMTKFLPDWKERIKILSGKKDVD